MAGELLCPKNVSFGSQVEHPEGGRSSRALPHWHQSDAHPHSPLLSTKIIKREELKARVERKTRKLINKSPAICGLWHGLLSTGWLVGKLSVQENTPGVVCVSLCSD